MMYRTHMVFGALFAVIIMSLLKYPMMPLSIIVAALAALLPDIDHPKSKASNTTIIMKVFSFLFRKFLFLVSVLFNLFVGLLSVVGLAGKVKEANSEHRGPLTHTPVSLILFGLLFLPVLIFISPWLYFAILIGIFSHIVADSLNDAGILWFWPLSDKRFTLYGSTNSGWSKLMSIKTSSAPESVVYVVTLLFLLIMLINGVYYNGISLKDFPTAIPKVNSLNIASPIGGSIDIPADAIQMPNGDIYSIDGVLITSEKMKEADKTQEQQETQPSEDIDWNKYIENTITNLVEIIRGFLNR